MKKIITFLLFVLIASVIPQITHAISPTYPIADLGYCRDAKECYFYCQIAENKPACWSYQTYIMPQVLGETTATAEAKVNVMYPVAELGNCANAKACHDFCEVAANRQACIDFAQKKGIGKYKAQKEKLDHAKIELGCDSIATCISFCQDSVNQQKCQDFAKKYVPEEVKAKQEEQTKLLEKAKETFGCDSITSCKSFCDNVENKTKCEDFAKEHAPQTEKQREEMLQKAKQVLPCNSVESCKALCQEPANREKCSQIGKTATAAATVKRPEENAKRTEEILKVFNQVVKCNTIDECRKACLEEANKDKCKGITQKLAPSLTPIRKGTCTTDAECAEVCKAHPDQCPGYPSLEEKRKAEELRIKEIERKKEQLPVRPKVSPTGSTSTSGSGGEKTETP